MRIKIFWRPINGTPITEGEPTASSFASTFADFAESGVWPPAAVIENDGWDGTIGCYFLTLRVVSFRDALELSTKSKNMLWEKFEVINSFRSLIDQPGDSEANILLRRVDHLTNKMRAAAVKIKRTRNVVIGSKEFRNIRLELLGEAAEPY